MLRFGYREHGAWSWARALTRLPLLIVFLLTLPREDVRLSDGAAGAAIAEHLSLRAWGMPRFRLAQGILRLPPEFATYLRGRRRQALRTNLHRAAERGIVCDREPLRNWTRSTGDLRPCEVERWWAVDRRGDTVAQAWLSVAEQCALLHGMESSAPFARWALHTAIVQRLCAAGCPLLLTNSHDVPLLPPGQQHFQHLLGYSIARLRPRPLGPRRQSLPSTLRAWSALVTTIAAGLIVAAQLLPSPIHLAGHRALVWLTALVAVRVTVGRGGWATLAGGAAAVAVAILGAPALVSIAYLLAAALLDLELSLFPALARRAVVMPAVGVSVILVTVVAPAFPTLGHHAERGHWAIPPLLGAVVFGAIAAVLGNRAGRTLSTGIRRTALVNR